MVSGILNATGSRLIVIDMIYLLVSQVLGEVYLSRYFLFKLNYRECWIVPDMSVRQII